MAQATVELRTLLERTNFKLFDFDYAFDDKTFKAQLEQQIIDYYYDYEIGQETPDMFKRKFKARWNRIISYYNKMYNTTLLTYNPLTNEKLTEVLDQLAASSNTQATDMATASTGKVTNDQTNTTEQHTSNATTDNSTVSDYPQQPIAGGSYASGASSSSTSSDGTNDVTLNIDSEQNSTDNTTNRGTVTNNGTVNTDYTKTIEGITGSTYPDLITKHRDAILRISDMIIHEMKPCFILVY